MTPLQFILGLVILAVTLVIVRAFWLEIAVFLFALYVLGEIIVISLGSAILWAVFVTGSAKGWGWTFLYFIIVYCSMVGLFYMITKDVFSMVGDALVRFIKRLK